MREMRKKKNSKIGGQSKKETNGKQLLGKGGKLKGKKESKVRKVKR